MAQFRRRKQTQLTRSRLKEIDYKNIPLYL